MENSNKPAYPQKWIPNHAHINSSHPSDVIGLTKREYFAAMALQGICANPERDGDSYNTIAEYSVSAADKLLTKLDQPGMSIAETKKALQQALTFIEGFEDDETQKGVPALCEQIRSVLNKIVI